MVTNGACVTIPSEQLACAFLHDGSLTSNVRKETEIEDPGLLVSWFWFFFGSSQLL